MPPKRRTSNRSNGPNNNSNSNGNSRNLDPATLNAVNQAVAAAVAQRLPQALTEALQAYHSGTENNNNNSNTENGPNNNQPSFQLLLERFQKQKPNSFIYKLEGDARRWWKTLKDAEGEGFVEALAWRDFLEVFYQHYFSYADREAYIREYSNIRMKPTESITVFMERFVRLAGIAGTKAGDAQEQAQKFKWAIDLKYRRDLVNITFEKVSDVANAAKNLEMEHADFIALSEYNRKRVREDHYGASDRHGRFRSGHNRNSNDRSSGGHQGQWQGQSSNPNKGYNNGQGQWQGQRSNQNRGYGNGQGHWQGQRSYQARGNNYGPRTQDQGRVLGGNDTRNPNTIPIPPCAKCGRNHPGKPCYRETGQCFSCGQTGHMAKDCPSQQNVNRNGGGNNQRATGRIFAMTAHQAATSQGTVSGILSLRGSKAYVLFDTGSTHSVISSSFAQRVSLTSSVLDPPMSITTPMQTSVTITTIYPDFPITIEDNICFAQLLPMTMHDFDIILGMDWLSEHQAIIDFKVISAIEARKLIRHGCEGYLAAIQDTSKEASSLEDQPIVNEFPDVFPEELPGLPPER
ncbi:putative nucleotidyltransferase, ribonuclease H [Tanacetum coccineum]